MGNVLFAVDGLGLLNAVPCDSATPLTWQEPQTVGFPLLPPGAPVAVFTASATVRTALVVDASGVLTMASFDMAAGWLNYQTIGQACYNPGSSITVFAAGPDQHICVLIDRIGVLNAVSFKPGGEQSADTYGSATFIPGSIIGATAQSATQTRLVLIDATGVLNGFLFDASAGWSGPTRIGNPIFVPDSGVFPQGAG